MFSRALMGTLQSVYMLSLILREIYVYTIAGALIIKSSVLIYIVS